MMEKVQIPSDFQLALAIAIVKGRGKSVASNEEGHWREKAKRYKQELNSLRQQIQEYEENDTFDKLPALGPCDCLFFSAGPQRMQMTESSPLAVKDISKFSVQLFLRNVRKLNRAKQNKRAGCTTVLSRVSREMNLSLKGHLASVLQFITNLLCDAQAISKSKQFSAYVHHSVKFIKDSVPRLIDEGGDEKYCVKQMMQELTSRLCLKLLNYPSEKSGLDSGPDARVWIQQTSYQLGSLPYIGHQFLHIISKLIAEVAESLVCSDPFHEGVAQTYDNLYFLFQLFERLLSDNLCEWAKADQLNVDMLKDTLEYHFSTVKFFGRFPDWNSLMVQYSNRITGEIKAQLDAVTQYVHNHNAEGSQHMALLYLIQMATSANLDA